MSYGGDDSSIPDKLRLDYAPTSRASCKGCGRGIGQGEVRCGVKVRSQWHDGFDMHFHHVACAPKASGPGAFKGVQRLRWADQAALADALKMPLDESKPAVKKAKRLNELVWGVVDKVASVPKKQLREALEENDRFITDKMSPAELAYMIGDSLVSGLLPPCPFCECNALVGEGGMIRCAGFAAGTTSCASIIMSVGAGVGATPPTGGAAGTTALASQIIGDGTGAPSSGSGPNGASPMKDCTSCPSSSDEKM